MASFKRVTEGIDLGENDDTCSLCLLRYNKSKFKSCGGQVTWGSNGRQGRLLNCAERKGN